MSKNKTPKHCDIDLNNWRYYKDELLITTNSRWLSTKSDKDIFGNFFIPKRTDIPTIPEEVKDHHGLWISEIPFQMIHRFTKENDTIWSIFGGTGIDYDIATFLNRKCVITI